MERWGEDSKARRSLDGGVGGELANVISSIAQVRLFLFPEKIDVEVFHQRCELVRDVLQRLGARLQRV